MPVERRQRSQRAQMVSRSRRGSGDPGLGGSGRPAAHGMITAMSHPRAGQPAQPEDLVDVAHLVTAYFSDQPDPEDVDQQVAFGTSGHRGSALSRSFNEAHILATTQAICEYRASQGYDGPLFLGRDTHALSEPAWVTALEVLAAVRRGAGWPTASWSPPRTTPRATAASSTTRPTAAPPTPTRPRSSPPAPTSCCAPASRGSAGSRSPGRGPRRRRTTSSAPTSTTCRR